MTKSVITCDRCGPLIRAARWDGKKLQDLYVDWIETPDYSGAIVGGKVVRVATGHKAAWIDCGLPEKIYCESPKGFRAGEKLVVQVRSTMGQGKAWGATLLDPETPLCPPPAPWQRAYADCADQSAVTLRFADQSDYAHCLKAGEVAPEFVTLSKEPVHPELDEMIDGLRARTVPLQGGAHLVIEPTEALVAIDVNSGEGGQAAAVNLLAVREAARQLRLRNLSGLIVIDALKMKNRPDVSKVLNALERVAGEDPAGAAVFGMTKLGLIEMTRTRRRPPLDFFYGKEG